MSKKTPVVSSGDKKLKIQIGVCKRMLKEVLSYEKEVITNEARVQKMRDDGKDIFDIRKQEEVLQESYMMIPDSKGRCEASIADLASLLEEFLEDSELSIELLEEAKQILGQLE